MEYAAIMSEEVLLEVASEVGAEAEVMEAEVLEDGILESELDDLDSDIDISNQIKFSDIMDLLFQDDFEEMDEEKIEALDTSLEDIKFSIGTEEGMLKVMENHPERESYFIDMLSSVEVMNNPDATPMEIRSAQSKISNLKGQLLETAVKDHLNDKGFDVVSSQRSVEGESGITKPDIEAKNNTDSSIQVFGVNIEPGEQISIECKCGGKNYMENQLKTHIPNQLSGLEGTRVLLATSDIKDVSSGLAQKVCEDYGAKLAVVDVKVSQVENVIKGVTHK